MPTASTSHRSAAQRIAVILAVIIQIGATFLPQFGIGQEVGERSDAVRTLVTPIGWAFAIWGPLFAGSVAFAIFQALPSQRDNALLDRIAWFAAAAFFGNGLWVAYTQSNALTVISVVIISATLVSLLVIYRRLYMLERPFTAAERWLVMLPLSGLAAWLTAATIVNLTATLTFYGVGAGEPQPLLAAAIIVVGGVIASLAIWRGSGNPVYALVFLWALLGISMQGGKQSEEVAMAVLVSAVLVILSTAVSLRSPENRHRWFG